MTGATEIAVGECGYQSDRVFMIWFMTKSHSRMLLKSDITNVLPTRIELLCYDVAVINLPSLMNALDIRRVPLPTVIAARVPPQKTVEGKWLFEMSGNNWSGYVVCGGIRVSEARKELNAPSDLLDPAWESPFQRA